ncbi:hypothetical protein F4803DRAFT_532640 [Xylaria telfairii]|nr:hypothetical protein F4803DRAFT_532640 [Xylaria telfairii]
MVGTPRFWAGPLRYYHWAARERPAWFWACLLFGVGPAMVLTVPPVLKRLGYERAAPVPTTYPIPTKPRIQLTGYDD